MRNKILTAEDKCAWNLVGGISAICPVNEKISPPLPQVLNEYHLLEYQRTERYYQKKNDEKKNPST